MIRLFFKTNLKEDKIFRLLLMVQLTIITCVYFVACYLWDDYQNGNIKNVSGHQPGNGSEGTC